MQYKISVIIPVYNRTDELYRTLKSLEAQTVDKCDFEVVIADDGSAEEIRATMKQFPSLNMKYCRQEDEGFRVAAARNLGIEASDGEILVFDDNGILLRDNCLAGHLARHKEADNLVVLGSMLGTDFHSDAEEMGRIVDSFPVGEAIDKLKEKGMLDGRTRYYSRFGENMQEWYIPWLGLWGGHFSVKKTFLDSHGIRFDENFHKWGGEDNDFGVSLCLAGAQYRNCSEIEVVHIPGKKTAVSTPDNDVFAKNYLEVKRYFAKKYRSREVLLWCEFGSRVCEMSSEEREQGSIGLEAKWLSGEN